MTDNEPVELYSMTLTYGLRETGEPNLGIAFADGTDPAENLVTLLGMLRMAEDTVIRAARGDIPDDEEEDQ